MGGDDSSLGANLGDHCYNNKCKYGTCCGIGLLILIIIISISWDVLEPTEMGLLQNTITREVNLDTVYGNGRYFVGPAARFLKFPSNLITVSYGNNSHDEQRAIAARTGGDEGAASGEGGGGQPLSLSISFQYQLTKPWLADMYRLFGTQWESSYMRFAQQAITNEAQSFTPRQFWTSRRLVERAMHYAVNKTLVEQGFAHCQSLQLRAIGFQSSYEQTITNIQLQEQLKVTKTYQLDVTKVLKEVDLLQSTTDAKVRVINAEADREKRIIEGRANADALQREQSAKAEMYKKMSDHLGWSSNNFLQYIKMKAINDQQASNVVVGVNALGAVPSA